MRKETNLLQGKTVVIERPKELADVSPSLARLIPRAARDLFSDYPSSFRSLAAESSFLPLKRWLQRMGKAGRCELAVHLPGARAAGAHPGPEVFLQIGGEGQVLLSGGLPSVPKRCPKRLSEVLRLVGVIRTQYGASGGLIHPSLQRALPSLLKELKANYTHGAARAVPAFDEDAFLRAMQTGLAQAGIDDVSAETFAERFRQARQALATGVDEISLPARPKTYYAFYEDGCGGYSATNARGETWQFPLAGGDSVAGPPLDAWFTEFFDSRP